MNKFFPCIIAAFCLVACSGSNPDTPSQKDTKLVPPTDITVVHDTPEPDVVVSWTDTNTGEAGYSVWVMDTDTFAKNQVGTVGADCTQYIIKSGLEYGNNYYIGVRADAADEANCSEVKYEMFHYVYIEPAPDPSDMPHPEFTADPKSFATSISFAYKFVNVGGERKTAWGLCWSADHTPTIEDTHAHGPKADQDVVEQLVTNVTLDYGKTYKFRAYLTTALGTWYSPEIQAKLGTEPDAITFSWSKMNIAGLPSEIEVYKTTDKLNGRNFNAWYAIADMSKGNVEFRVQHPAAIATVNQQFGSDCYVLTNAGYFSSSGDYSFYAIKGVGNKGIGASRGSLKSEEEEYNVMYNCTKGVFGTDSDGKPAAMWGATGRDAELHFFDAPMAVVKGRDKYEAVSADYPCPESGWKPYYAVTSGPVLVKNGKCVLEPTTTRPTGDFYLTNYEIIAYDIFGTNVSPDRTAVGFTADGKMILFVCDGRINASDGATIFEMSQIMKGLGCVDAVNFDGGGSTAMVAMGTRLNSLESNKSGGTEDRKVSSTMGFFKKQ